MPLTDYERNIKLLNERIQWYKEEREKFIVRIRRLIFANFIYTSTGVLIGAVLMYIFYRCPS